MRRAEIESRVGERRRAAAARRRCCSAARASSPAASSSAPPSPARWSRTPTHPARRAARQSRLQAARGAARRAAEALRRPRLHRRLRDDRADRGAAVRRQHRDAARGPRHPVRADRATSTGNPIDLDDARRSSPIRRSTRPRSSSRASGSGCRREGELERRRRGLRELPDGPYTIGIRPHHIRPAAERGHGGARSRAGC